MSSAGDDAAAVTPVGLTMDGDTGVAVIRIDDDKVNAFTLDMIEAVRDAVRHADAEASAIVVLGRSGSFSAGLDRNAMAGGPDAMVALFEAGSRAHLAALPASSFGPTKRQLRAPVVAEAQAALDDASRLLRSAT